MTDTIYKTIGLIDVSYLFARNWHAQTGNVRNEAAADALREIGRLRSSLSHVIVCADAPPYNRATLYPEYKGGREDPGPDFYKHRDWLMAQLHREGFVVAASEGYEADDIMATLASAYRLVCDDVRLIGPDKDLFQLLNGKVRQFVPAVSDRPGVLIDEFEVEKRTGVMPSKMVDWQALVGDSSDNVPGCKGIGPKTAAKLLQSYGSIDAMYRAMATEPVKANEVIGQANFAKLKANKAAVMMSRQLVRLHNDAPVNVEELLKPRKPVEVEPEFDDMPESTEVTGEFLVGEHRHELPPMAEPEPEQRPEPAKTPQAAIERVQPDEAPAKPGADLMTDDPSGAGALVAGDRGWELALEPNNMHQAVWLAKQLAASDHFPKLGRWQGYLSVMIMGRELGLGAMAALMNFHLVEGRPAPSAQLVQAFAQQHPDCEYFRLVSSDNESATYETKRRGHPDPVPMSFSVQDARDAGLFKPRSGWEKWPAAMCRKMAAVHLARAVYPDSRASGLYCPEEMGVAA